MNNEFERIKAYISDKRPFIESTLARLVRIPSVRSAPEPGAPYGRECRRALEETTAIFNENGFSAEVYDDGYSLAHCGGGGAKLGVFGHADVVPVGDGWTLGEPFSAKLIGDFMVGRGTGDDKAGVVASLLAAMAIRDLGLPFRAELEIFVGSNEESGMGDIRAYRDAHELPEVSIVPDAAFPLYRGEKGILRFWAVSRRKLEDIVSFEGGDAFNIVLGKASVGLRAPISVSGEGLTLSGDGRTLSAIGLSKHAAMPEGSKNAAFMLAKALGNVVCENDRAVLSAMLELAGNYCEGLGVAADDPDFGKNTSATGMVRLRDGRLAVSFDVRYAPCTADPVWTVRERLDKLGFDCEIESNRPGFIIGDDNEYLKLLLRVYSECTGAVDPKPCLNGGGTYARYLKNAFGIASAGWRKPPFELPAGHGGCHQPDEFVSIDGIVESAAILTYMLVALDRKING